MKGAKALEASKNPANFITGFEEFYAEPPLRADEAIEEKTLYDPRLSVALYNTPSSPYQIFLELSWKRTCMLIIAVRNGPYGGIAPLVVSIEIAREFFLHT